MQLATMDNLKRAIRKAESQEISDLGKSLPFWQPQAPPHLLLDYLAPSGALWPHFMI